MKITLKEKQLILKRRKVLAYDSSIFDILEQNFNKKKVFIGVYDTAHGNTSNLTGEFKLYGSEKKFEILITTGKNSYIKMVNIQEYIEKVPFNDASMELISKDKKVSIDLALQK
jgi:hypothetical protein